MTQIRLFEAASKHTVSLGFFKLALEAGCEVGDVVSLSTLIYIYIYIYIYIESISA
jgi:hypothetical protein